MKIFANPMSIDVTTAPDNFQLELLHIQSDIGLREAFQSEGLLEFCSKVSEGKYLNLIANALKNSSVFGLTYVCEALFSKMVRIRNQYRNRLTSPPQLRQDLTNLLKLKDNVKFRVDWVFIFFLSYVVVFYNTCLSFVLLLFQLVL